MTLNKAQGQIVDSDGIHVYPKSPVLCGNIAAAIIERHRTRVQNDRLITSNIVYRTVT